MLMFKSLPLKNYHIEVVLCLKGSDDDDVQCTSCHFKFGFHPDLRGFDFLCWSLQTDKSF